jgi:hypothetical protein
VNGGRGTIVREVPAIVTPALWERDSEEAFRARRQIVRLLVKGIVIEDRREDKGPSVRITYRFDEPSERGGELCEVSRNTVSSCRPRPGVRAPAHLCR